MAAHSRKMSHRRRRRASRRRASYRRKAQRGGQAPLNDNSMNSASKMSIAQGQEYAEIHANQHGGAAVSLAAAAPLGYTGMLDDSLRAAARIGPIDASMGEIQGMSDQSGGARRRRRRAYGLKHAMRNFRYGFMHPVRTTRRVGRNVTRGVKRVLKMRAGSRRKMRGGAGAAVGPMADYASPGMLLTPAQEARALMGMNQEWRLAADPKAFMP